ncbi:hypothetical protein [Paenibacillus sp. CF095]|uniref:hypothetical protein n=1 Tax=Paenibacillus sp. CF095 TaxID=1881033 RepID=UPI00115F9561|nr:hypothetical protein [Paenibacillus sp. CF095]
MNMIGHKKHAKNKGTNSDFYEELHNYFSSVAEIKIAYGKSNIHILSFGSRLCFYGNKHD